MGPWGTVKSFEKSQEKKTRLNHLDSLTQFCRGKIGLAFPSAVQSPHRAFYLFLNLTWFCLSEHSSPTLLWAFTPSQLKDAGSNIGVRVSLGDNRGLQFPDNIQLHHPNAELQEYSECAGGGKATV